MTSSPLNDKLIARYGKDRYQQEMTTVRRFWAGHGKYLVSWTPGVFRSSQTADAERRFADHLKGFEVQAKFPGLNLPSVFCDYGTVSQPLYWGDAEIHVPPETGNPYIDPVANTLDEALRLKPRRVDDPEMHVAQGVALFKRLQNEMQTDSLWMRSVDTQGVLNTAGLVLQQEELLMSMYEQPRETKQFLDRVCEWTLELWQYQRDASGGRICGNLWPYTFLPQDIGVSFTEDMMPLLSPELYEQFSIPYLRQIEAKFGGLHIHCCGEWGRHVPTLKRSGLRLLAMEFHYPYTKLEELAPLAKETVFVPYIAIEKQDKFKSMTDYYRYLISQCDQGFRFWFPICDDSPESMAFVREFAGI